VVALAISAWKGSCPLQFLGDQLVGQSPKEISTLSRDRGSLF